MQFQMTVTVLGVNKMTVEGRTFCNIFTGQPPVGENTKNTLGLEVTKIGAEVDVFDQIQGMEFHSGDTVTLVATLRKAAQGKSQPHIVGVVPNQKPAPASEPQKKSA